MITVRKDEKSVTIESRIKEIKVLLQESAEMMADRIIKEVPQSGKFTGISVSFLLNGTENIAFLLYQFDVLGDGSMRRLRLGVRRVGLDYMITSLIFKGTNKETIGFLNFSENQIDEFAKQILELSDDAEERDERFIK